MGTKYKNFNYLDQLKDTTIDLNDYLERFSTDRYEIKFNNYQPVVATVANIFEQYDLIQNFKDKASSFVTYKIKDKELIEDVAIKYYGSEDFWWVVALFNDINNPLVDWPKSEDQINYLVDLYLENENAFSKEGYYKILFDLNEQQRIIEVLKPEQMYDLVNQFRTTIIAQKKQTANFTIKL